ncbi:MAG: hypothetical protein NC187_05525 [Candidatus Amulumruptor caecigallinarius]|nr:hypothetical protein [Candidatus Amulumruptor caecigallinarius]MCM1396929.1 hypothetical protein [Candidatus Amulumruptor caecigallinarius]MCM1454127.1 hypothetical protein [bacterium]
MTDPLLERYLEQVSTGSPVTLSRAELAELRERYPFFSQPAASALESGEALTSEEAEMLRRELSLNSADLRDVEALLRRLSGEAPFYPAEEGTERRMTTESTIDAFLERYGNPAETDRELSTLEKLIFNPVAPDYLSTLGEEESGEPTGDAGEESAAKDAGVGREANDAGEGVPVSEHDRLIDAFLSSHTEESGSTSGADGTEDAQRQESQGQGEREAKGTSEQPDRHALLSESLAKIFIKRGKYEKAFEIIHSLSLNYPEKSVYFADQLRFLQKAILISRRRESAQHLDNQK